ncbi:transposase [Victivallis sp. Marseille-Q1083]|uniref:transposase n=1 Tax=Victivallis sp. Marseille-Q1083 TaxID=2717288 RepID=UPI00158B0680|nr:transposase [Victivallis sp. Marseille-Q1083]
MNWCDKNEVKYIVGLAKNPRLLELSKDLQVKAEALYNETHEKAKLFTQFEYAAGTWKYPRRVIAKAEFNSPGPNNRFIVTNLDDDGQYLYEKVYCARGEMENRIKEQQLDLFADRTSCHDFAANQFRLLLSSLAYILMERFRALLLTGTQFAEATCGSIRLYLVKIGAIIRRNTRKIYVALSSACPNQELLRLIAAKIIAWE